MCSSRFTAVAMSALLLAVFAVPVLSLDVSVQSEGAELREGAGWGYASLGSLRVGESLELLQVEDSWAHVRRGGMRGWVHVSFLQGVPEPEARADDQGDRREQRRKEREEERERKRAEKERARREKAAQESRQAAEEEARKAHAEAEKEAEKQRKLAEKTAREEEKRRAKEEEQRVAERPSRKEEKKTREQQAERGESDTEQTGEPSTDGDGEYDPLDDSQILDEVVTGIYESGSVGPGVVDSGPKAPKVTPPATTSTTPPAASRDLSTETSPPARASSRSAIRREWAELPPPDRRSTVVEEVVARINDDVITLSELEERLKILDRLPDAVPNAPQDFDKMRTQLLPRMVDEKLLIRQAELLGVNKERVYEAGKQDFRGKFGIKSDLELLEFLDRAGMDMSDLREVILRNYLPPLVLQKEVRSRIRVTSDEITEYYEEHRDELRQPETLRLREIVLLDDPDDTMFLRTQLLKVLSRLEAGIPFEEVARDFSRSPSAEKGGDLGELQRDDLAPEMLRRVDRLVDGEVASEKTPYGYHVVKLEERRPTHIPDLVEVEDRIRHAIQLTKAAKDEEEYLQRLRSQSYIQVDPKYEEMYGGIPN